MEHFFANAWQELTARLGGPLHMRFILQPTMALLFAIRDGLKDARTGRPAYLWALFSDPPHRRDLFREGWHSVGKIFILAFILDTVYQLAVLKAFRPVQGLLLAALLAVFPYAVFRGPVSRVARIFLHRRRSVGT
jgi:hypothetical protein